MPPRPAFPWLPPAAWPYRIFLGLWTALYAGFYGFGTYSASQQGLPLSVTSTAAVLGPLIAASIAVWFAPRLGWGLALIGTAALSWRLFRSMGLVPGIVIGSLLHIPVLSGLPLGWLEQRRNAARAASTPPQPQRKA